MRQLKGSLNVHLNSPGGDVFDGLTIYQALKARTEPTTVVVDGLAASIASVIAMGADKVIMAPKATLMIHDGWSAAVGNAADMRKLADRSEEHTSELQSLMRISYAVFCLKKKKNNTTNITNQQTR